MENKKPPLGQGQELSESQLQQFAGMIELAMSPLMGAPDDEGSSLQGVFAVWNDETRRGKEIGPERLQELEEAFDNGLATEIDSILVNYQKLYYPSDWEIENQLKLINTITNKIEKRIKTFEKKQENGETLPALRRIHKKLLWAEGLETVLASGTISIATYFAAEERLKNIPKIKVTAMDNQKAFYESLEGLPAELIVEGRLNREAIIEMQDEAMDISLLVACGLHQRMPEVPVTDSPSRNPLEREKMFVDKPTRILIEEVFATRDEDDEIIRVDWIDPVTGTEYPGLPAEILNYYSMSSTSENNKRLYTMLMTAMIDRKAIARLNAGGNAYDIAKEVRTEAKRMLENYFSVNVFKDTKERFANLIARATVAKHLGDMSSGELGWGWFYEVATVEELEPVEKEMFKKCIVSFDDLSSKQQEEIIARRDKAIKEGRPWTNPSGYVVVRISEIGSIYSADDTPSPFYPERYVEEYQARAESAAEVHKGLADSFRRLFRYYPPDWKPPLDKFTEGNHFVQQMVDFLLTDGYADKQRRHDQPETYGNFDPRMLTFMEKYKRAWPTWATVGKVGPAYAIPLFYPPSWYSLNFWRSIGENGKKAVDAPSQWERLMERRKLSKIDYRLYADHVVDWENVNRAQLARGLVVLFLSNQFSSDGANQYGNFVARPLNINTLKDWDKRMSRLGFRGGDSVAGIVGMLTFVPIAVKLIAEASGIGNLANPEFANQEARRSAWNKYKVGIAELKNNALYLPKSKGVSKAALQNTNNMYGALIDFYSQIEQDWQLYAVEQTKSDLHDTERMGEHEMEAIMRLHKMKSPYS